MSKTFEFQEQLQTLPLSNLDDAAKNFLNWVEPLLTKKQFDTTKNNLQNFINKDGLILEKRLAQWSKENNGNWLAPLWKNMYLDIREPVVIDVNYFVKLRTKHLKIQYKSNDIAGVLIHKLMEIYEKISDESFEPDKIKDTPFCMAGYKEMFKATKIPKLNRDEYIVKPKTTQTHIVVLYKNHMFKVDLTTKDGEKYSSKMITNTLNTLLSSDIEANDTSIGILTTAPRNTAAGVLENILTIDTNSKNFEVLKEALFIVCMDEDSQSFYDFGKSLIASNENNRYFDKNAQLIFTQNGDFGFNLEHTGADAGTWINLINKAYEELDTIDQYLENESTETIQYEQLDWELSDSIKTHLNELRKEHIKKTEDIHFEIKHHTDFGAKKIKSLRYSPDAFLQLALQLAQYRTFGKLKSTYEAVANRSYLNGRTECTRPISMELLDFVQSFDTKKLSDEILREKMTVACKKQSSRIKDCLGSNGVERYFFALKNMYTQFGDELDIVELPEFFNDEGYNQLIYSYISTNRANESASKAE